MSTITFGKLVKIELVGEPDIYVLEFYRTGCIMPVTVEVSFKAVEQLILTFHFLGVLGNRRQSATADCHITTWEL